MEESHSWEADSSSVGQGISRLLQTQDSLPCSQEPCHIKWIHTLTF